MRWTVYFLFSLQQPETATALQQNTMDSYDVTTTGSTTTGSTTTNDEVCQPAMVAHADSTIKSIYKLDHFVSGKDYSLESCVAFCEHISSCDGLIHTARPPHLCFLYTRGRQHSFGELPLEPKVGQTDTVMRKEMVCVTPATGTTQTTETQSSGPAGGCVPHLYLHHVCDGHVHCPDDKEDETCTSNDDCLANVGSRGGNRTVHCPDSTKCISTDMLCDGVIDCPGGDDERDLTYNSRAAPGVVHGNCVTPPPRLCYNIWDITFPVTNICEDSKRRVPFFCQTPPTAKYCQRTCGLCTPPVPVTSSPTSCQNQLSDVTCLAYSNFCTTPSWLTSLPELREVCARTCEQCVDQAGQETTQGPGVQGAGGTGWGSWLEGVRDMATNLRRRWSALTLTQGDDGLLHAELQQN